MASAPVSTSTVHVGIAIRFSPGGRGAVVTTVIDYESESDIVETDANSQLHLRAERSYEKYARIIEHDGTIRLVPLARLHESERAVLENRQLYEDTRRGLEEFAAGKCVSTDWLFDEDE